VDEKRDDKRTDLKAALRELADEESAGTGPHVGLKRLIAYRRGDLPAAEREAVQEHLSLCPRCTGLLREMRDFETAAARGDAAGSESLRDEAWESLAERLPRKESAIRPIATGRKAPRPRRASYAAYGLAAALLLAVLGLAVWATVTLRHERQRTARLEQTLHEKETALAAVQRSLAEAERRLAEARGQSSPDQVKQLTARIAELTSALGELRRAKPAGTAIASRNIGVSVAPRFALRGQESPKTGLLQAGGTVNPVHLPTTGDRVTVALSLADHPAYDRYRFELMDRAGDVLWAGHRPASALLGDAGTSVSFTGLTSGLYRLRIEGLQPERSELVAEYVLKVEPALHP
jgi:hypothetical protein